MGSSVKHPEAIGTVLNKLFSNLGIAEGIKQQQAILVWNDVVGPVIANVTEPVRIEHGRLYVEVENNTWRQELHYYKHQIVEKLNNKLNSKIVKEIILV